MHHCFMTDFSVTILGCGSAKPTLRHFGSSQIVDYGGKLFMVDCAEGTQLQFRRYQFHDSRLGHIFISHSHGDHCLGLVGLLSSQALSGRHNDINIYAPFELKDILMTQIDFFVKNSGFNVYYHPIENTMGGRLYEDEEIEVTVFPLLHRVPCFGFLFKEKPRERHIKREFIEHYGIGNVDDIKHIKRGGDYITPDGIVIPNQELTTPPNLPRSYAYSCDTLPNAANAQILNGVDLLYHDATYADAEASLAEAMCHSTARQAAEFAVTCNAKILMLGHYSSRYKTEDRLLEEAVKVFPNTILANEGIRIEL